MAKTLKLTHSSCNVKGSEGMRGDVVTIKDDALADRIIAGRGGRLATDKEIEEAKAAKAKQGGGQQKASQ